MKRLWAPWRMTYVGAAPRAHSGCVFCDALSGSDDRKTLVLRREAHAFLILNAYPYAPGHLMAVVNRHVGALAEATPEEIAGAMALVTRASAVLTAEYRAEGFNIGLNQGRVAGAGIVDHLHIQIVPRWNGDTNFMSVFAEVRVVPEALEATYDRLRERLVD
ncbi:MAG: HIT domain-containing protein [candidate division NC10 bacterium]